MLAWLNQASGRLTPTEILDGLAKIKPGISKGTIANVGTRLAGKVIDRTGGWMLLQRAHAPVLHLGHLWGEPSVFENTEVATYRRRAIKHVLGAWADGLQIVQVTAALKENCPWFNSADIPVSKDLVKMDMKELQKEGAARRKGNSGKWELTEDVLR